MKTQATSIKAQHVNTQVEECPSFTQEVYSWTVGIANPEAITTLDAMKEAIAFADPERRYRGKYAAMTDAEYAVYRNTHLAALGVKLDEQFIVANKAAVQEHIRRRTLYGQNKAVLLASYARTGSVADTILHILGE